MSSSEEDDVIQPVKLVKRRKRVFTNEDTFQQVNLFSHKVMPTITKMNQNILMDMAKDLPQRPVLTLKIPYDVNSNVGQVTENYQSDEDVQFVNQISPLKLTPPPEEKLCSLSPKCRSRLQKKRKKLLTNLESVLFQAKQDQLNQSAEIDPVSLDSSITDTFTMVKVRFHSQVHKYPLSKDSSFREIFDQLATDTKTDKDLLLLVLNDQQIDVDDTPNSIGLSVIDFIDAVVLDSDVLKQSRKGRDNHVNCINIHFQCKFEKHRKTYLVNKFEVFHETMKKYASSLNHDVSKLRFIFDGEIMDGSKTPDQLEMENDDCLDVMRVIKKS